MTDQEMETIEVELTAMANGGSALGRSNGRVVFVPYTIPGETVRARVVNSRGRVLFAEGETLLAASDDRVLPECPHFGPGRCGRCQWQHIRYEAQLLLKQDVLADQMARVGDFDEATLESAIRPVIASETPWGYAFSLAFIPTPDGLALVGADDSPPSVISECHILHPDLADLLGQFEFEPDAKLQRVRLMRASSGEIMLVLTVNDIEDAPNLELDFPASINLILPDNLPVNLVGDLALTYMLIGKPFRVTAGTFLRANVAMLDTLAGLVLEGLALTGGEVVLDLYGGFGLFSAVAAPDAAQIVLVDSYQPAAEDARVNLADFQHVSVIEDTVESVLERWAGALDRVILDPPADGLSLIVVDAMEMLKPGRIVYVSSDPATLARDAKRLARHGYRLASLQPIDLSPQTYFIDCVATLVLEA
jgi:23S rRNA (uracil1939-C5)-methyltransferase